MRKFIALCLPLLVSAGCKAMVYDHRLGDVTPPGDERSVTDGDDDVGDPGPSGDDHRGDSFSGDTATGDTHTGDQVTPGDTWSGDETPPGDTSSPSPCEAPPCFLLADSPNLTCVDGVGDALADCSGTGTLYGQDASILLPAPDFGTAGFELTDNLSGLVWYSDMGGPFDFGGAESHCAGLGGEWRLPTFAEGMTLYDYGYSGVPVSGSAIAPGRLSGFGFWDFFWTSEPQLGASSSHWVVNSPATSTNYVVDNDSGFALCVRGEGLPADRFRFATDIAVDQKTGLTWQNDSLSEAAIWVDAIAACNTAIIQGQGGWRLPTIKELLSLADRTTQNDALYPGLINPSDAVYWSATPDMYSLNGSTPSLLMLESNYGSTTTRVFEPLTSFWVRCVRGPVGI